MNPSVDGRQSHKVYYDRKQGKTKPTRTQNKQGKTKLDNA